jgi:ribosomal-protein-alanine N-acetyltransferase
MASDSHDRISICNFRPADFPTLHGIDRICFSKDTAYSRAEMAYFLSHPAAISKVAVFGAKIVGFVIGQTEPDACGHVITLDVIPEARRRGVGCALMEALHAEFRLRGIVQIVLEVAVANEEAQRFYARLGYSRAGRLRQYYKTEGAAFRMSLSL